MHHYIVTGLKVMQTLLLIFASIYFFFRSGQIMRNPYDDDMAGKVVAAMFHGLVIVALVFSIVDAWA